MQITLVTEGTYPTGYGGVSVWCDQLISGLPEHSFRVQSIVATGTEPPLWPPPVNVTAIHPTPLWSLDTRQRPRRRSGCEQALSTFLDCLFRPGRGDTASFLAALRALRIFALRGELTGTLRSTGVTRELLRRWHVSPIPGRQLRPGDRVTAATVDDAVRAADLLEHFLRPLAVTLPPSDLCHAVSNGLASLIAFGAKWDNGTPFLLTEHGLYLRERYLEYRQGPWTFPVRALLMRYFGLLTAAAYQAADYVAPGSDYNGRWQVRHGASAEQIRRIHNGIDPTAFPPAPEPRIPTVAWLGRITPIKDLELLITAFRLVTDRIPRARLRLFGAPPAGDEDYYRKCAALVDTLGIGRSVTFEGRVDSPSTAYQSGSVVALSSRSEGFPYTVIEAMATGRATVSTDVGGVREAVGATGLVVPPGDAQAFAAACIMLLRRQELRRRMGLRARVRAHRLFTLQRSLDGYRDLYPATVAASQLREVVTASGTAALGCSPHEHGFRA